MTLTVDHGGGRCFLLHICPSMQILLKHLALPLVLVLAQGTTKGQADNYPVGSTVENFITLGTDGTFYTLHDITASGKVVILDFFFYDCEPCQGYAPYFSELYETYGCNGGGLFCLSVNAGIDTDEQAEQFSIDFGGDFSHPPTIGMFNGGLLTDIFGVNAFPTVCVIDVDNTMLNNQLWPTSLEDLIAALPDNGITLPMSCTLGIGPVRSEADIKLTPSITSGRTDLRLELQRSVELRTEVTDQLGRSVLQVVHGQVPAGRSTHALDLGELSQGSYFVRVFADGKCLASSRVVVAH